MDGVFIQWTQSSRRMRTESFPIDSAQALHGQMAHTDSWVACISEWLGHSQKPYLKAGLKAPGYGARKERRPQNKTIRHKIMSLFCQKPPLAPLLFKVKATSLA